MKYFVSLAGMLLCMIAIAGTTGAKITGTVRNESGKPVAYAVVTLKGTVKQVFTNAGGQFTIQAEPDMILVVTASGYETTEVTTGTQATLEIVLRKIVQQKDPVRIKADTLAMKLTAKEMELNDLAVRAYNYNTALQGKVAGLQAGSANIRIRGLATTGNMATRRKKGGIVTKDEFFENAFDKTADKPLSTFGIDVDAASYSNIRRMLRDGRLPSPEEVRIEEMVNYFSYEYSQPAGNDPFKVHTETAISPWNPRHRLLMIGLQGKKIAADKLPPANLTFLVDVSGSMMSEDRLPLVKASLKLLAEKLRKQDQVSLVAYAGNAGLVLPATSGSEKDKIIAAIDRLEAGGSTAGGAGIELAYNITRKSFAEGGNNRVILCTDGDFNVGVSSVKGLEKLIEKERESGIFLTVLGYGTGNYQDEKMQQLADKGNGNHAYIDDISEARKVLVHEFGGTLFTIAKDVKLQVEFNPSKVQAYRLIGYENRMLAAEDFNDDKKDAGELGSGHTVTAIYELVPPGVPLMYGVDSLRYTNTRKVKSSGGEKETELAFIKLRYKEPAGETSRLLTVPVTDNPAAIIAASENLRFAAAVASFGMLLRNSKYKGGATYGTVRQLALKATGRDENGYRKEFLQLVDKAALLSDRDPVAGKD
ncbi:YfbK domain-containing protein [Sediminibacterium ginsengisoli]|uniref:Ca-activated chloride channel family protein n=1 Tax=Sediminibacterium ginsengisoli TaxID=413434 RepID=A0A1T4LK72_9BACT|nr:von Willebrand factor type A domain-containing protein [Sediminibacterium ginsengisoli]SJZ55026.1 Ca-activated chloride channel family protein [Sediminibacterium ginsengisoli]